MMMTRHICLIACLLGSPAVAQDSPAIKPSTEDRFEIHNLEGCFAVIAF